MSYIYKSLKFIKLCSKWYCCEVETMFGRSLEEGIVVVGVVSLVLSLIMLSSTLGCIITIARVDNLLNTQPMAAVNFIFSLVACCLSTYQILITMLLLWQARQEKGNIFICSLWYVSHISLLSMYFLLFSAKLVVCCCKQHHYTAVFTVIIGVIYEGAFIYFSVVVNSYLHSLHQERYL